MRELNHQECRSRRQSHRSGLCCVLSRSVVSDSLRPHGTVARQAPLSVGFSRQEYLEWVAISFSRESSQPRD